MKVMELVERLGSQTDQALHIMLPDGSFVPEHFHITEIGRVHKDFVDCGGTRRDQTRCVLQVWVAKDFDHRLRSKKLGKILKAAAIFVEPSLEVEIEYETEAVSQYPLAGVELTPSGMLFVTGKKHTACLAPDKCGVSGCC